MSKYPQFEAHCLGGFSLVVDGSQEFGINQPQQQSLLTYLMLQTEVPQLRKHVAFLFWPDSTEKRAYANLRYALHKLRNNCPSINHYLMSTSTTLYWQPHSTFTLDVIEYETWLKESQGTANSASLRKSLVEAASLYRGEILPGCYDDWLLAKREQLNQGFTDLLNRLIGLLSTEQDYEAALRFATQLRLHDPLREKTYQLLMTLYESLNDRANAIGVYNDCVTMLEREFGASPSTATQEVYERLSREKSPYHVIRSAFGDFDDSGKFEPIGRQDEWNVLRENFHLSMSGHPRLVLLQGEAGIGKTYLAKALLQSVTDDLCTTIHIRAYAIEGQLAYSPIIEWLRSPPYINLISELDETWLRECVYLLPEIAAERPHLSLPKQSQESWQRQHLFEALARAVLSVRKPLLVLFDDLQWADNETLEWLNFLMRFDETAPFLLIGTVRMSEVGVEHSLSTLRQQLYRDERIYEIHLQSIDDAASDKLAQYIAGSALGSTVLANLRYFARGVPFFLSEIVRAEISKPNAMRWQWSIQDSINLPISKPNSVPLTPKIYAAIQARINQLTQEERQIADLAAVIGCAFSIELMVLICDFNIDQVVNILDQLWQRRIIDEQGYKYDFSHDRIRDVAYAELSPIKRKRMHQIVANTLHQEGTASLDNINSQLAYHYEVAGFVSEAARHYLLAGKSAERVYAYERASNLFNRGIALNEQLLDASERATNALSLHAALGISLRVIHGWTSNEVFENAQKIWQLSHTLDDQLQLFQAAKAIHAYHVVRGNLSQGEQFVKQLSQIADRLESPLCNAIVAQDKALIHFLRGEFKLAQRCIDECFSFYTSQADTDEILTVGEDSMRFATGSHFLWMLGYPEQALRLSQNGVDLMRKDGRVFSTALTVAYQTMLYQFRQQTSLAARYAQQCIDIVQKHNISYYEEWSRIFLAWNRAMNNPNSQTEDCLRSAINKFQKSGARVRLPFYLSLLVMYYEKTNQPAKGLSVIDEALASVEKNGEKWWNGELYRLQGNLRLFEGDLGLAEDSYKQAIDITHAQDALTLELRATVSLARLWKTQGKAFQAHHKLMTVFQKFGEGFDTSDLQDAQALLANLK